MPCNLAPLAQLTVSLLTPYQRRCGGLPCAPNFVASLLQRKQTERGLAEPHRHDFGPRDRSLAAPSLAAEMLGYSYQVAQRHNDLTPQP